MFGTLLQQGRFTSDGNNNTLQIRSDLDWMWVRNYTNYGATGNDGIDFFWQRGFADGAALYKFKSGGGNTVNAGALSTGGFTLVDTSGNPLTNNTALTNTTNATQPVVSTTNTGNLTTGSIVRLYSLNNTPNIGGIDFEVDTVVSNTSFRIRYALASAPGAASTSGNWRQIKWDPIYYPRWRFVANITAANPAVITTTVSHGYTVGQKIRIYVPSDYGMTQINGLQGTITAVTASTITTDIDASSFTSFAWPAVANYPFSFARIVPVGEDLAEALSSTATSNFNQFDDAVDNQAYIGMILGGGGSAPGGASSDVMYWVAGKSFRVDNQ